MNPIIIKNSTTNLNLETEGNKAGNNTSNKASKVGDQLIPYKLGIYFPFIQQPCLIIIK